MKIEEAIKQDKFQSPYQKLMVNVAYTNSYVNKLLNAHLKAFDLSMQQFNVLRILRGADPKPVSINSITDRMIDKMSNASRLVEKLKRKELIARRTCEHDRRQVDVIITDKGKEVLKEIDQVLPKMEENLHHLGIDEVELLNTLLDKFRQNEQNI